MGLSAHKAYNSAWCCTSSKNPLRPLMFMLKMSTKPPLLEFSSVSDYNFQELWLKVQCKKLKSFLLCTVYRPPNSPISFLEHLENVFVDSLLTGMEVIIIGGLNCNLQGNCSDGHALSNFCSNLNLPQLVKEPTRVTER